MNTLNFAILIFIYSTFLFYNIFKVFTKIYKEHSINLIDFFQLFYLFFYSAVPICTLIVMKTNDEKIIKSYFIETDNDIYKFISCALSIIFYYILIFFIDKFKTKKVINNKFDISEKQNEFYISTTIMLIVGWISLFIYTYAYGGIFDTFKYAEAIRNNVCTIENKFSFLQPLAMFLLFVPFNYLVLIKNMKKTSDKYKKIILCLFTISIVGMIFMLLIIDSRSRMLMTILIVLYYLLKYKFLDFNKKNILKFSFLIILFLLLVLNSETISGFLHNQQRTEQKTEVHQFIAQEFGYTYLNDINIIYRKTHSINGNIRILEDIKALPFSLFPRSIQRKISDSVTKYNTSFYNRRQGSVPSDLISSSIYSLGYVGPFVFPILIAFIISVLNNCISKKVNKFNYYLMLEGMTGFLLCMPLVANFDLPLIIFSFFDLLTFLMLYYLLSNKTLKEKYLFIIKKIWKCRYEKKDN